MTGRRGQIGCATILAGMLVAVALVMPLAVQAEIEELTIGIGIDADTLNPQEQTTTLMQNMCDLLFDNLVFQDPKGNLLPRLIEKYDISADGLTWTLHVRQGVKFQDGTPLNAEAVKLTMDRALDPKMRVPLRFAIGVLKGAEVVDPYTVRLDLKYPFAPLAPTLSMALLTPISPAAIKTYGEDVRQHPVGAGPYKLTEWVKGDRIVMVRNEDYWGEKPTVKKIVWKIVPEVSTREAMLRAGQIDICYKPSPANVAALQADAGITVEMPLDTRSIFMALRTDLPVFQNKLVRQAFNYAIDKKAIVQKILFGTAEPMDGAVSPILFGYAKMDTQYDYNPEKAKALLKEANFDFGRVIRMATCNGRYLFDKQVSEAVQAYLQDIGIKAELRAYDWPTYMSLVYKPADQTTVDMDLLGWGPLYLDSDMQLYGQFTCAVVPPNGLGSAFYCNSAYDKIMEQSRREQDVQKREALLKDASKIVWDECPWIWLHVEKFVIAYKSNIKGLVVTPTEKFYPTYLTLN